jgi:hypothetical protein
MPRSLPSKPSLEYVREEAKDLLTACQSGDASVCEVLRLHHRFQRATDREILAAAVSLQEMQHALALDYGFKNWVGLKKHLQRAERARSSLRYWERGWGDTPEEKVKRVCDDSEWSALIDEEARLEPLSEEATKIRGCIARMEPCHESFAENVSGVLKMIGSMTPGDVLDCGKAGVARAGKAKVFAAALQRWDDARTEPSGTAEEDEVKRLLGSPDDRKRPLVVQLIQKLGDNAWHAHPPQPEDFDRTEALVDHLEICAHYWEQSLHVLLEEIGAGRRTRGWHSSDGFNSCGDCPNQVGRLMDVLKALDAWLSRKPSVGEPTASSLGERTQEKAWLVASLCKHIRSATDMGRIISS